MTYRVVSLEQRRLNLGVRRRRPKRREQSAGAVDELEVSAGEDEVGVRFEQVKLAREAVGQRNVVAVHAREILAARLGEGFVKRDGKPLVLANRELDARVALCVLLEHSGGGIFGPVVNHDQFE